MALRRHSDGTFDLKLYVHPTKSTVFQFSLLLDDYDYDAYITATPSEKALIEFFVEKKGNARAKESYAEIIKSHREREAAEKAAQTIPSSDPVEQLASTVEKLSLSTEAKYTAEDAERFLAISGKPGAISALTNDDQQKFVYWKIDRLQALIAKQQSLEADALELNRRRDLLLMQTGQKILAEIAEQGQSTSSVLDSSSTKKITFTQ
ncbi:hypothetical protein CC99x_005455 [Candidatus Berkiella cookevillensis]|uniref:Uncharacterized protein n=1 Tax=Candidatus Berkiella cookevillensis TaxID=437022 RepID=A0A0Q9YHG9_9GAMM|nr:hypothetical protein [Candidatus Berkiella cookevillensis]MCS5708348.1 hypothetical protein [Candidatus Berkiella cookevillensis]